MRIYTANLDWSTGATPTGDHLEHLLTSASQVVVGCQEAKNVNLKRITGAKGNPNRAARQRRNTLARAGSGFALAGVKPHGFRLHMGGNSSVTLTRWIARIRVDTAYGRLTILSAHVPPARAGAAAQARFLAQVRKYTARYDRKGKPWVVCIDANQELSRAALYLGGEAYGAIGDRIVGLITSNGLPVKDHGVDRYGKRADHTDHLVPWIDVA